MTFVCHCPEHLRHIKVRAWVVVDRNVHHSTFNGSRATYSRYSAVVCKRCRCVWRTKAKYVGQLKNGTY